MFSNVDIVLCFQFNPIPEHTYSDLSDLLAKDLSRVLKVKINSTDVTLDLPVPPISEIHDTNVRNDATASKPWSARVFVPSNCCDQRELSHVLKKAAGGMRESSYCVLQAMVDCNVSVRFPTKRVISLVFFFVMKKCRAFADS